MSSRIYRTCLTLARLCSAMWIGAALLFVLTSITEQTQPAFNAATRDRLALIRFPWYYATGATLLILSAGGAGVVAIRCRMGRVATLCLVAALTVMAGDYLFVYGPLRESLTPPGSDRTATFERLHVWSERVNSAGFLLAATAAMLLCATRDEQRRPKPGIARSQS